MSLAIGRLAVLVYLLSVATLTILARPCATEDSTACTWYAAHQGNGRGVTFTAVTDSLIIRY